MIDAEINRIINLLHREGVNAYLSSEDLNSQAKPYARFEATGSGEIIGQDNNHVLFNFPLAIYIVSDEKREEQAYMVLEKLLQCFNGLASEKGHILSNNFNFSYDGSIYMIETSAILKSIFQIGE